MADLLEPGRMVYNSQFSINNNLFSNKNWKKKKKNPPKKSTQFSYYCFK